MNEQHQADALAEQLDALLSGETPTTPPLQEWADLLQIAGQLSAAAPTPRPEFGPVLKASLLQSTAASAVVGGTSFTGTALAIVIGGMIVVLVTLALLANNFLAVPATSTPDPSPAPVTVPENNGPVKPAVLSPAVDASTPQPTITNQAADTLILPSPPPTAIMDVLPPITVTVESTGEVISLPELLPGQPSSDNDDNGGDGGNGSQSGDSNRGHGNDSDGTDDDNPGKDNDDD